MSAASPSPSPSPPRLRHQKHFVSPSALDAAASPADTGLPPTPPSASQDGGSTQNLEATASDHAVNSLMSSLSTPVNARSPPTPDPSPPRTTSSAAERPAMLAYPSSRAESFKTAREDPFSSETSDARSITPLADRFRTIDEDHGLGLAFEHDDSDKTPTEQTPPRPLKTTSSPAPAADADVPVVDSIPDREWNTDLMRNVTVRRKRYPHSSPRKDTGSGAVVDAAASPSPSSRARRSSSLRERVAASNNSPHTPSMEDFAQSIGWPSEQKDTPEQPQRVVTPEPNSKRLSTSSVGSAVVEAMVIVTPPRRRQTLRHSGKNMAYRRDISSPATLGSGTYSHRSSVQSEDIPLHRLVHKRASVAERPKRSSTESDAPTYDRNTPSATSFRPRTNDSSTRTLPQPKRSSTEFDAPTYERNISPTMSFRQRTIDSSAHTLAHQESVRRILQPAADILSRSNSLARPYTSGATYSGRISSAPASSGKTASVSRPRNFSRISPPASPLRSEHRSIRSPTLDRPSTPVLSPKPSQASPASRKEGRKLHLVPDVKPMANINKSLPEIPVQQTEQPHLQDVFVDKTMPAENVNKVAPANTVEKIVPNENVDKAAPAANVNKIVPAENAEERQPPAALMERVRRLVALREAEEAAALAAEAKEPPVLSEPLTPSSPAQDQSPRVRRGSHSSRGRSGERRRSSLSRDRSSLSPDANLRPSLDRVSTDEMMRRSHEWRRPSEEHGRVSFDRSTIRTEEHAMARHLFSQTTPFSQFSDTPIEVSEATAVSIFPHNNHSLLVVQQGSRGPSMFPEEDDIFLTPQDHRDLQPTPTPPFVDASEVASEDIEQSPEYPPQPTLTVEPSTPPMQIALPQPGAVDSPLKNPRPPPEPPKINFIPPTPAEELERPVMPGPPKRSESHPQRRLSLAQRARRYSDNLIPTLLARASSNRSRGSRQSQAHTHRHPRVPTVNDEDGTLHPFWRPRGFWDDFDDTDSESDEEGLPVGGDTSDVEDAPAAPPKRTNTLGKRLASGLRGSGGFLIGNSLGVERHGTNKRRHHVTLPPHFPRSPKTSQHTSSPKILVQPPTIGLGPTPGGGISKRGSRGSLRSDVVLEPHRRVSWRQGRSLPGLKKYQVQYIGLSGVKERFRERSAERRRDKLRQSIGTRYYVEPGGQAATVSD